MFAVQNGGLCVASATAPHTFDKYGYSEACKADGEGGPWANQVYVLNGKKPGSCLPALEEQNFYHNHTCFGERELIFRVMTLKMIMISAQVFETSVNVTSNTVLLGTTLTRMIIIYELMT